MTSKTDTSDLPAGNKSQWLQDRMMRAIIGTALALPYKQRVAMMGWMVRKVIAPAAGYLKRAEENLKYIWPEMPEDRRAEIAAGVCDNFGRMFIENYSVKDMLARADQTVLTGEGLEAVRQAKAEGRPVLFVTGHFGNCHVPRAALVAQGYEVGLLYRPIANGFFNDHYSNRLEALSGPLFEQGRSGTMSLVKHLKKGGMALLLFDVYDSDGEKIDFMGKPAPTLISAAKIAERTGALLVPFFGIRQPDGYSFVAEFDAPLTFEDPLEQTKAMSAALEKRVEAYPEQWFWVHRRWKPKRQRRRAAAKTAP